jgi:uncharacterized BrkB/YihY/UPF0761 family membrane protein
MVRSRDMLRAEVEELYGSFGVVIGFMLWVY